MLSIETMLSKNGHTYIASHGDPPFGRHNVCRVKEDKEKEKGYKAKITKKTINQIKILRFQSVYLIFCQRKKLRSRLYELERDPNSVTSIAFLLLAPRARSSPRRLTRIKSRFLVSRDHFCFIGTDDCGVLCFQELNNRSVCAAKCARHCPIRKSDWGYIEANGRLEHAGQPQWTLISGYLVEENVELRGIVYLYR
jgi:hypothetical protein